MNFESGIEFAKALDNKDRLKKFRDEFLFPQHKGNNCIYFTGNSLGLMPKSARELFEQELSDWAKYGVEGHFDAKNPWVSYHEPFSELLTDIVGAKKEEIVVMNTLTTNLHLLMVSFYNPTPKKFKILCEQKPFPSDYFVFESQLKFHGFSKDGIVEVAANENGVVSDDNIIEAIQKNKDELALVLIGGVNYYTGQRFNMQRITKEAKKHGITVGFDLAHAAGNVDLNLHNWEVDFAAWCSYKYLNSGPGAVSGVYIHKKHHNNDKIQRFNGWWGHEKSSRFEMKNEFVPIASAEAWQQSNAPVFNMVAHRAALNIVKEAGIKNIFAKRDVLTAYTEFVINESSPKNAIRILTPTKVQERGSQLSLYIETEGKQLFDYLTKNGVIADWREPNVIRIAPAPLYNSFEDSYNFGAIIREFYRSK